jgi:putative alpha-1,2-mannosidase
MCLVLPKILTVDTVRRFSHESESASPGYYSVIFDDYKILAELTATTRAGFHRYTL